jgi:hypothetical protein
VGSRGSIALSFLTLASILPAGGAFHTSTCPSSLVASEWDSWFLLPFCKAVHCSSFQQTSCSFLWQPADDDDVFAVWYSLVCLMISNDQLILTITNFKCHGVLNEPYFPLYRNC